MGHKPADDAGVPRPENSFEINRMWISAVLSKQFNNVEVPIINRPKERIIFFALLKNIFPKQNFNHAVEALLDRNANWRGRKISGRHSARPSLANPVFYREQLTRPAQAA